MLLMIHCKNNNSIINKTDSKNNILLKKKVLEKYIFSSSYCLCLRSGDSINLWPGTLGTAYSVLWLAYLGGGGGRLGFSLGLNTGGASLKRGGFPFLGGAFNTLLTAPHLNRWVSKQLLLCLLLLTLLQLKVNFPRESLSQILELLA